MIPRDTKIFEKIHTVGITKCKKNNLDTAFFLDARQFDSDAERTIFLMDNVKYGIPMNWIYLSPHLDDVALSAGGLLWEQERTGEQVSVWTICAGDPGPEPISPFAETLQNRWRVGRDAVAIRRSEDVQSCAVLGGCRNILINSEVGQKHSDF